MNDDDERDLARETGALPRAIEPPRDLWAGVAPRIERKRRRTLLARRTVTGAAMLLAAAAIALSVRVARSPQVQLPAPPPVASEPLAVAPPPPAATLLPEEASYHAAITSLAPVFDARKAQLPANDARAVGKSLSALDAAIAATRASLTEHPDDADLRTELDAEYQQELDTMNDVLEWTTRS